MGKNPESLSIIDERPIESRDDLGSGISSDTQEPGIGLPQRRVPDGRTLVKRARKRIAELQEVQAEFGIPRVEFSVGSPVQTPLEDQPPTPEESERFLEQLRQGLVFEVKPPDSILLSNDSDVKKTNGWRGKKRPAKEKPCPPDVQEKNQRHQANLNIFTGVHGGVVYENGRPNPRKPRKKP